MELVEQKMMDIRDVADVGGLLKYFCDHCNWNLGLDSFESVTDYMYEFTADDLGIKPDEFAKIRSLYQLPPLEEEQQWGVFCVEFATERFSITALRKILARLVPSRRNASSHAVWDERDLLFLCFWGTGANRTICIAHFEQKDEGLSSIHTIHCSPASEDPVVLKHFVEQIVRLEWPHDSSDYQAWYNTWMSAFSTRWHETIETSAMLAKRMAVVAKEIKDSILEAMKVETANGFAHLLFGKVKSMLVHDLKESEFADMYAQTIVYGLFSARCLDKTLDTFSVDEAIDLIPNTNPFLKGLMRDCLGADHGAGLSFDELGVSDVVEMFSRVDAAQIAADFGRRTGGGREDPVIYFYEEFLKAYDKEQKVKCGEFYTPQPVVGFMVRAVDHILKTQFNLPDGLATDATKPIKYLPPGKKKSVTKDVPAIQILDPATGTGTFLREIILNIHSTFVKKHKDLKGKALADAWSRHVDKNILPRLNGFELMMAPYAIAHMKLAMVLQETGYDFKGSKRLQVYLTNSLEEPGSADAQMTFFDDPLAAESIEANRAKQDTGINIVIGNPPFSGISQNKGEWITKLISDYKMEPGGTQKLQERKNWLNDDYVKFMRLAQYFVERSGAGIFTYINPHGYLDNPTFRGMRWCLSQAFDEIYILNLHGNSKRNEICPDGRKDENVFDIQQGVSINILVKNTNAVRCRRIDEHACKIHYADAWGLRGDKYEYLEKSSLPDVKWQTIALREPMCFFVPKSDKGVDEYNNGFRINDLVTVNSTAVLTMGDSFTVANDKETIRQRIQYVNDQRPDVSILNAEFLLGKNYAEFILSNLPLDIDTQPYSYRPFDKRWINFSSRTVWRQRLTVMTHFKSERNMGLVVCRQAATNDWALVNVVNCIVDDCFVSNKTKERGYVFPLYLYQDWSGEKKKVPNLDKKIWERIASGVRGDVTPEDVFYYIYAVLHSPKYREKYKEFLKIDFPRVPYPTDNAVFRSLVELGSKLVAIHTMKDFEEADDVAFDDAGGNEVQKVKWDDGAVFINKTSRFIGVEKEVFDHYIGGYQPLQKWLKDRKGRILSAEDISHYKRIVRALRRTRELMSEIDEVYDV